MNQASVSKANSEFWDELCGTQLATHLGITDNSPKSLKKFDDYFFDFYPYLENHIPFNKIKNKKILEVGLGYGSVSQKLIEHGAIYHGLDIANGPVHMVKHRLNLLKKIGTVKKGSILDCPFEDNSFDHVISIGCYHHTGDIEKALQETYRILKPGGQCSVMVYYAYSYRRWCQSPSQSMKYFMWDKFNIGRNPLKTNTAKERGSYDVNSQGQAAPATDFLSRSYLRYLTKYWSASKFALENIGAENILSRFKRNTLLKFLGPICGLDVYCQFYK